MSETEETAEDYIQEESVSAESPTGTPAVEKDSAPLAKENTPSASTTSDINKPDTKMEESTPESSSQGPTSEQYEQFRQMLAGIRTGTNQQYTPISLNDVLTPQALNSLLQDNKVCESLYPYLPEESTKDLEEVRQVVRSPQFSQSLHSLSAALQTGQLGPLLSQLGLDPSAGNNVEAFLKAIMDQAKEKNDRMEE
ncbi:hypothetical protein BDB01DRAFT_149170 [Pilobolus umbonatus]|nr:hypothetical protein BDB01DRAFT_149170 [Pilobolus umbonatus]